MYTSHAQEITIKTISFLPIGWKEKHISENSEIKKKLQHINSFSSIINLCDLTETNQTDIFQLLPIPKKNIQRNKEYVHENL